MYALRAVTSPVCQRCKGVCCTRHPYIRLTSTDIKRIKKHPGAQLLANCDPHTDQLGCRSVRFVGQIDDDPTRNGYCCFWSKQGCTLGAVKPLMCRLFFCHDVLRWALKSRRIPTKYLASAAAVLNAAARGYEDAPDDWACREWAREYRERAKTCQEWARDCRQRSKALKGRSSA